MAKKPAAEVGIDEMKKHGQWKDVFRRLRKNKLAMVGLAMVVILILSSVFANVIAPYDPYELQMSNRYPRSAWSIPSARTITAATFSAASSTAAGRRCS